MSNGPGPAMYRFLECTASQYMMPAVETVTRQVTMRDLETLFEKYDFNAFPVVEKNAWRCHQVRFPPGVCLHNQSD